MKYTFIGIALIYLLSISCNNESKKNSNYVEDSVFEIVSLDSFYVESAMLELSDYRNGKYLLFNRVSGDIIIYDLKCKKQTVFNHYGNGDKEYPIMSDIMYFWTDTSIAISRAKSIVLYSLSGDYLDVIDVDREESYYPIRNVYNLNDSFFVYREVFGSLLWYAEKKNILVKRNLFSNQVNSFVEYPLEGLDYYAVREYIPNKSMIVIASYCKNMLYIGSGGRENLYMYDLNTLSLIKEIMPEYDYFRPKEVKKGEMLDFSDGVREFYLESVVSDVFVNDSMIFTIYSYPSDNKEIEEYESLTNNFTENMNALPQRNLALSISVHEKKLGPDLKLKTSIHGTILHIADMDNVLISVPNNEKAELSGTTMLKHAKIRMKQK